MAEVMDLRATEMFAMNSFKTRSGPDLAAHARWKSLDELGTMPSKSPKTPSWMLTGPPPKFHRRGAVADPTTGKMLRDDPFKRREFIRSRGHLSMRMRESQLEKPGTGFVSAYLAPRGGPGNMCIYHERDASLSWHVDSTGDVASPMPARASTAPSSLSASSRRVEWGLDGIGTIKQSKRRGAASTGALMRRSGGRGEAAASSTAVQAMEASRPKTAAPLNGGIGEL
eukprot:CAMPEP_0178413678 /NCGR_PEP_ID=MMETSP0689_2-20121128/22651_1 /TAXON_ID=160604 /ORGANISM="Amphidinium massartii, Strain CS-259" /LENGTH=226 /DNA_ID=CAMNT_0020034957 /DNA_START=174 /DNA_END=854 /DNA_ORIENTATION=+